jgi:hydrogenase 3 maturation protease
MDKIIILGVGNSLKCDDWIGCYTTKILKREMEAKNIQFIVGGVSPEAFAEKIVKAKPTKVVILDAVDMGLKPGQIKVIDVKKIKQTLPNTHKPSLRILIDYLRKTTDAVIKIIGIQPKNVDFGERMSREVKDAVPAIKEKILKLIR